MYNVGDIVRLNEWGMQRLYWWQFKEDTFIVTPFVYHRQNPKEFFCRGVETDWHCVLTTDLTELVSSLPINLEDFL